MLSLLIVLFTGRVCGSVHRQTEMCVFIDCRRYAHERTSDGQTGADLRSFGSFHHGGGKAELLSEIGIFDILNRDI